MHRTPDDGASGAPVSLHFEVLTAEGQIAAIVPEWDALALRDPNTTPYDCGTLMTGLSALASDAATPYILLARSDGGKLHGVLPLRRIAVAGRLGGHKLAPFAAWHGSYFDASIDPGRPGVAAALMDALLARRDWERCDLQYLRPEGNLHSLDMAGEQEHFANSHVISGEAFSHAGTENVLAHKSARRLSKAGRVEFTPAVASADLDATVRRFAQLHTQRWLGHGDSAEFATPEIVDRLLLTLKQLSETGVARVGCLRLDGAIVAVHIAFRWRDVQYSWRMAHDPQWQAMSPGRLLMSLMIEEALSSGLRQYDLGRGDEHYKQLWPTVERPLYRVQFPGTSWRARFAAWRGVTRSQLVA